LLYSGAAIVDGEDQLFSALRPVLDAARVHFSCEELDPDIFSDDSQSPHTPTSSESPPYFLQGRVAGAS